MRKALLKILAAFAIASLGACSALDTISPRAVTVNRTTGDYSSRSILLNIVRASRFEPLNFVSMTKFTGHDDGTLSLPGISVPPSAGPTYAITNSTANVAIRNDFDVNAIDDPASYQALLTPVAPYQFDLFIRAGYPRELLYILFIDYMKVYENDPDHSIDLYSNFPEKGTPFENQREEEKFIRKLERLVEYGLTASIARAGTPPVYSMCFDKHLPYPSVKKAEFERSDAKKATFTPICDQLDVSWRGGPVTSQIPERVLMHTALGYFPAKDDDGSFYEIHTRSVLGAYQYLGRILQLHQMFKLSYADTQDSNLLEIREGTYDDCFTSIEEYGQNYCVPNSAANTKRMFSILRQFVNLLTAPSQRSATDTVRAIP